MSILGLSLSEFKSKLAHFFLNVNKFQFCFIFDGHMPFSWATDTPVFDFWRCLLCASKSEWATLFALDGGVPYVHVDSPLV